MSQYIGKELFNRMNSLGYDATTLADMTFMDENSIKSIIDNKKSFEEVDEFDMDLICDALHCSPEFFTDKNVRKKDLLYSTMNRGNDTIKSKRVKASIQSFLDDYSFVNEVMSEIK